MNLNHLCYEGALMVPKLFLPYACAAPSSAATAS